MKFWWPLFLTLKFTFLFLNLAKIQIFITKFDVDDYNYKDPRLHHLHTWSQHLTAQIVINRQCIAMMITITITGANVQEAIDLEREVLREEGRRGPAVRWVLNCCTLSLFCNSLSLQGE